MLFTIGDRTSYEQYFSEQGTPQKKGRVADLDGQPYLGGVAFLTYEEALSHSIGTRYAVYGLDTDIGNTYEIDGMRRIIETCNLLKV